MDYEQAYGFSPELLDMIKSRFSQDIPDEQYEEEPENVEQHEEDGRDYDELQGRYDELMNEFETLKSNPESTEGVPDDTMAWLFESSQHNGPLDFTQSANQIMERNMIEEKMEASGESADVSWLPRKSNNVNVEGLHSTLKQYINTLPDDLKKEMLATSGNDQSHVKGSKHYENKALDLRYKPKLHEYIAKDPLAKQFGINVLDPNHGTAPHTHMYINQYGGEAMRDGGKRKMTPQEAIKAAKEVGEGLSTPRPFNYDKLSITDRILASIVSSKEEINEIAKPYNKLVEFKNKRGDKPMSPEEIEYRKRIASSVKYGYPDDVQSLKNIATKIDKGKKGDYGLFTSLEDDKLRSELIQQYMGINEPRYKSHIKESQYKPSQTNGKIKGKYYDFSDEVLQDMYTNIADANFDDIYNNVGKKKILNQKIIGESNPWTTLDAPIRGKNYNPLGQLGSYTMSGGKDEKGRYLSYYDIWDLDPEILKDRGIDIDKLNYPFEIYGRIYEKDLKSKPKKKFGGKYKVD